MYKLPNKQRSLLEDFDYKYPVKKNAQENKYWSSYVPEKDEQTQDYRTFSKQPIPTSKKVNEHMIVLSQEEYVKLEGVLSKKWQMILENIKISKEKNKLKDKEMQVIAQSIYKVLEKIEKLEKKQTQREKELNTISLKCHDLTQKISKEQDKIKKEAVLLHEETGKCSTLEEDIIILQEKRVEAQRELERRKKLYESFESYEEENLKLRQKLGQLESEQKMLQYRENNDRKEQEELENKLEQLKNVIKQRTKINKRNLAKLNTLKKEIAALDETNNLKIAKIDEIKSLQLQMGELNQELLLVNEDISELEYKIKKKSKAIEDMKFKLNAKKHQQSVQSYYQEDREKKKESMRILQSQEDDSREPTLKKSNRRRQPEQSSTNKSQLPINSKNASPIRNRSNQTPTFPSNEINFNSESVNNHKNIKSVEEGSGANNIEAQRNIEKLINRFEQIKNKEKAPKQF